MPLNLEPILAEMDAALLRYEECKGLHYYWEGQRRCLNLPTDVAGEIVSRLEGVLRRYANSDTYAEIARGRVLPESGDGEYVQALAGVVRTLRAEYAGGYLRTIQDRIRSDVFSDTLERAEYLVADEGLKDPAAVLVGSVLEQHLRKLCDKHAVTLPDRATIDPMNAALVKAKVYGKNEQKQITAWAGVRNSAAHGTFTEFTADQVKLMIQGVRLFLATYPA